MMKATLLIGVLALAITTSAQTPKADPGNNNPPPAGAILDLNGMPIPGGGNGSTFQQYTVNFTATITNTAITFAFRDDPAFISFASASVTDLTSESGNLLLNGDFSGGTYTNNGNPSAPNNWTYADQYGVLDGGYVKTSCYAYSYCWYDGAVQAYDAISQTIPTTVGHTYQISFYVAENSGQASFSDLSTNGDITDTGGNGIDVTVYAQAGLPIAAQVAPPQPTSPGTTNTIIFNPNTGTLVEHILAFPGDAVVPPGLDPTTLQLQSTNNLVSNSLLYPQYVVGTPFAPSQCFSRPGNNLGTTVDNCSLYEDECFDATHPPSEFNCPTTNPTSNTDFIIIKDMFDPQAVKPLMAPNTTAVMIHFHPASTTDPNQTWSPTGPVPPIAGTVNPVCTNAYGTSSSSPPVQCDIVNLNGFTLSGDQTTATGRSHKNSIFITAYNVPMLESLVSANGTPLNIPGIQGNGITWFNTPTLNLSFLVNPGGCTFPFSATTCPPPPTAANNNFVPAPVAGETYGVDGPPSISAGPAANTSAITQGNFSASSVSFTPNAVHVLQWQAIDNVGILEQNIQLIPVVTTCPDGSLALSGNCYTTMPFSAQIGIDTVSPDVTITSPTNTTYTLNQAVPAAYTCVDPAPSSGIASFYSTPSVAVGSNINTSSVGPETFTVTCTDVAGNKTTKSVTYEVAYPNASHLLFKIGSAQVETGKNLTYGIFLLNLGPGTAYGVDIKDALPAGTSFVSAVFGEVSFACAQTGCAMPSQGTNCPLVGGTINCSVGTLQSLSAVGVKLVVKVTASAGGKVSNTATVTGLNPSTKTGNTTSNTVSTKVTR